jgi:integrase
MTRPRYVSCYYDRHGKLWWKFRRRGFTSSQTRAVFDTAEWWSWYNAATDGEPRQTGAERTAPGTMAALIVAYYGSTRFTTLRASTQATYRHEIERFRERHGDKRLATLEGQHIRRMLDAKSAKPESANNLLRILRILMSFAVERGFRKDNPTLGVRKVRSQSDGRHSWTEEEIAQFEGRWAVGTRERLAMALMLYTGQRRSDVVGMGRQHVTRDGAIRVRQLKTGTNLVIPVHPALQAILDATPNNHLTFLVTEGGKPFSVAGFGGWFGDTCRAAHLPDACRAHGLRKAAARRLAEAGATAHQIASVTGHKSLAEVERYTRAANQEGLAKAAMAKLGANGKGT